MSKVESIEGLIQELSAQELAKLREWFAQYDAEAWDRQMEADAKAGKLDALAERALRDHLAGGPQSCESLCCTRFLGMLSASSFQHKAGCRQGVC